MPAYTYRCQECGREPDVDQPLGNAARVMPCAECGGIMRLVIGAGVHVAPSALETKGAEVRVANEREARWLTDIPAYQRMRRHGMQPKGIDGAAALEDTVGDQIDIDYGGFYDQGVTRERVLDSKEQADEIMANGLPL